MCCSSVLFFRFCWALAFSLFVWGHGLSKQTKGQPKEARQERWGEALSAHLEYAGRRAEAMMMWRIADRSSSSAETSPCLALGVSLRPWRTRSALIPFPCALASQMKSPTMSLNAWSEPSANASACLFAQNRSVSFARLSPAIPWRALHSRSEPSTLSR